MNLEQIDTSTTAGKVEAKQEYKRYWIDEFDDEIEPFYYATRADLAGEKG
ncbi:hypothetical protein ACODUO_14985 [Stenotrophomonas maltophilia]